MKKGDMINEKKRVRRIKMSEDNETIKETIRKALDTEEYKVFMKSLPTILKIHSQLKEKAIKDEMMKIWGLINKIEKDCWDCKVCGCVNDNTDICPNCGDYKENSVDNNKLEQLKIEIKNED